MSKKEFGELNKLNNFKTKMREINMNELLSNENVYKWYMEITHNYNKTFDVGNNKNDDADGGDACGKENDTCDGGNLFNVFGLRCL